MPMIANTLSITNLFNGSNVYVIPSFQRPYAWEETQWDELIEDIRNATQKKSQYHYFAPIHVVPIETPDNKLWQHYTDGTNTDIANLTKSAFRSAHADINVFLVIDGQQRLITFYSLLNQYFLNNMTLSGGNIIPKVILNTQSDQIIFRNLLGLHSPVPPVHHISRAQSRLQSLFGKFSRLTANDPVFSSSQPCHLFLTGSGCETLLVELDKDASFSAFMTLNDRGKSLTNLEKSKSLFMEIDDNAPLPNPYPINNAFGALYQSLEADNAYIDDDEFLRQVGMRLWEGKNLSQISTTPWPPPAPGKNRNNSIHQVGSNWLYEEYFKKIPSSIANAFLHNEIIPAIDAVTSSHNHLIQMIAQATTGSSLNVPSFTQAMGWGTRDAIEDYHGVLLSLGLQSKQIGFLLATRTLFSQIDWHTPLGSCGIDNRWIKKELAAILAGIKQENHDVPDINPMVELVDEEINRIPDTDEREYTALQIAEALRLIVENTKPGGFSGTWNSTFRNLKTQTQQDFVQEWIDYLVSHSSRDRFIIYEIARSTDAYNHNTWVRYVVKEYESCSRGGNAHRNTDFEIEHFFPFSWSDLNAPKYLSNVKKYGFQNCEEYKQSFVDQIGNKLVLDKSLNGALKNHEPSIRIPAYQAQAYGTVNVMSTNPSASALQIGNQLSTTHHSLYRIYVQLRSLRLAAFAARRF